jgi:hypothetical protein
MKQLILLLFAGIGIFHLGFGQWNTDPMINTAIATAPGEEAIPKVAVAESGITYVSWFSNESGNYNIRLQKFDVYGNKLWAEGGLLVSDNPSMTWLTDWDMTVDQEENAILVLQDIRTGYNDVFAYRISPDGSFVWGDDGLQLSTGEAFDAAPKVTVSNAGNAFFAWQADEVIIGQKISPEGALLWGPNGLTMSGANTFSWPQLLPVGDDDIIMKFFEDSGPVWAPTRHVYAQRFDGTGNPDWAQPAVISDAGGISAWTQIFPFINDGDDGFYIAWHDDRDNNMLANMWVQHIGQDGSVLLAADGVEVSTMAARNHFYAHLALPAGSDDIYIYWNEMDGDQNLRGIYGQKVSSTGERLWTNSGKTFIEISALNVYPLAARNTDTDMVVFYEEYFNTMDGKIKAMRIATDGSYVWDPNMIDMCTVQSAKVHTEVSNMNNGQWVAVWEDDRSGTSDIYGQNIQLDGTLGPVSIVYNLDVYPDSLWFDDIQSCLDGEYFTIKNNTDIPLTIMNFPVENFLSGWMWWISNFTGSFPYTVNPGDSLYLLVNISFPTGLPEIFDYVYDDILIELEVQAYTVTICLNSDLIENISKLTPQAGIKNFPNPFNDQISFEFNCDVEGLAELLILNAQGNIVVNSGKIRCIRGINVYQWDGKSSSGTSVPGGIYFYTLTVGDKVITGRIVKTN